MENKNKESNTCNNIIDELSDNISDVTTIDISDDISDDEDGLKIKKVLRKDRPQIHLENLIKLVEADWQKFINFNDPQEEWIFKSECCGEELSKLLGGSFYLILYTAQTV